MKFIGKCRVTEPNAEFRCFGLVVMSKTLSGHVAYLFNATNVRFDYPGIPSDAPSSNIRYAYVLAPGDHGAKLVDLVSGPDVNVLDTPFKSVPCDIMSDGLKHFQVVLDTPTGRETIEGEILHSVATTYVPPSEELIGTDLDRPYGVQLLTCAARFNWDGETGYGIRERMARVNTLKT